MDDFRLAYDDHPGDGVPIVLLHGWPGDRQDYRAVVPLLEGRRVLVPDLRGFGDTTNPEESMQPPTPPPTASTARPRR